MRTRDHKSCRRQAFGENKTRSVLPEGREQRGFCISKTKRASSNWLDATFQKRICSGAVGQLQPPPQIFFEASPEAQFVFARTAVLGSPLRGNCYAIILPKSLPSATFVMTRSHEIRALINNQRRIACGNRRHFRKCKKRFTVCCCSVT